MTKVVLVCGDEDERTLLQACLKGNEVITCKGLKDATRTLAQDSPDLAVLRVDTKDTTGMDVLHWMKRSQVLTPTIVVLPRQPGSLETQAWQLGARTFLASPIRYDDFRKAMDKVYNQARKSEAESLPEITETERDANLSDLVKELNKTMKCPAGSNRVIIRSIVLGLNDKSQPRVCLRCPIRQSVGLNEHVYYEHIRKHCCGHPGTCDAVIQYRRLRQAKG